MKSSYLQINNFYSYHVSMGSVVIKTYRQQGELNQKLRFTRTIIHNTHRSISKTIRLGNVSKKN